MKEKGEICLDIIVIYSKNKKAKIKAVGKTINLLTFLVATSKYLAERVSNEMGVSLEKAENIVIDCIKDGMKVIKD